MSESCAWPDGRESVVAATESAVLGSLAASCLLRRGLFLGLVLALNSAVRKCSPEARGTLSRVEIQRVLKIPTKMLIEDFYSGLRRLD